MTLWSDVHNNHKRLIHKWKHYFPIYERHFKDFVYKPVTFLEIGCGQGGSLQMWKEYFGPHARIVGIDVNPKCKRFAEDQIEIHIGDQQDQAFLQRVVDQVGIPERALVRPRLTVAVLMGLFILSLAIYPLLGLAFFPRTDAGQFTINLKAPTGTRIELTEKYVEKVGER